MTQQTKIHLLQVAEQLFASQGYSATSLRQLTAQAQTNLAAVNYHFGGKKGLIQAVLNRHFVIFIPELQSQLARLEQQQSASLDAIFGCFIPAFEAVAAQRPQALAHFIQLIGRGYAESQGHLRRYFTLQFGAVLHQFHALVANACPTVSANTLFLRLHFTLGAAAFTLLSSPALQAISENQFQQQLTIRQLLYALIPFLSQGMMAPSQPSFVTYP
ncbi:hypothetical protein VST7929_01590 [Vibrio stylophorae]|uniref:HTH tetR-type domain-containing protein n=1 Tax=Vibrio stylophorae TaxID=659351 RepID=A0ABN8DUV9_9VIBR|nr:TetR/AcrR family transcriptional regulator [Vibrio stylophorae]CAH0533715.1 hypothetical protein VST7929_01590 [Vibrio stylophorae]